MRKQRRSTSLLATLAVSAAALAADAAALAPAASAHAVPSGSPSLQRLRTCESGGSYTANTGNGYYGAYQFSLSTWRSLGYSGLPSQASPQTQDEAARRLIQLAGWRPWPGCARALGLL